MEIEMNAAEKVIIRNQRLIMLALLNISANAGGTLSGMVQERLRRRIVDMERAYDWIAPPSERLGE